MKCVQCGSDVAQGAPGGRRPTGSPARPRCAMLGYLIARASLKDLPELPVTSDQLLAAGPPSTCCLSLSPSPSGPEAGVHW